MSARSSRLIAACAVVAFVSLPAGAFAQTYGFATLPPGTLNHTTASAVSKVLKEKGGMNVLVQPTAGDNVIVPMVGRGEAEIGITNIMEAQDGFDRGQKDLRIIVTAHALRTPFFVRKDSPMRTIADLKGKRVAMGYSAMRNIDIATRAMLATGGLTEKDVVPVLVPNVVRSADDFMAGNADMFYFAFGGPKVREADATVGGIRVLDMFYFAFGGPKVREADATVGGIRVLDMDDSKMADARKIMPWGYATQVGPGPIFIGVDKPMKVYSFDNVLLTHAKVSDDMIYKILATMEKEKNDLVAVQPVLREFSAEAGYKKYGVPYHPGALKYFKEKNLQVKEIQ